MCAHSLPLLIWFVLTHGQNLHSEKSVHCLSSISASPPSLLTQCQGTGCGTHPHARAFTHSMCLASSHVISPKFLSSSFLLQPHDTVFTGCLLRDGCGTNPRPPGPSPTLSGFFQMPSSPEFHSSSSLLQLNDTAFTRCHSETCATHPRRPGPSPILLGFFTCPHLHLYFRRPQPSGSLYGTLT